MRWWGSALHATQNVSLAPTVRIHWVLQSTSPSPVPFSFFSSFSSSCSRVKISLGFLYWTREKKKNYFDILPISLLQIPKLNHVERVRRIESKYPKRKIYCWYKNKYYCILLLCQNTGLQRKNWSTKVKKKNTWFFYMICIKCLNKTKFLHFLMQVRRIISGSFSLDLFKKCVYFCSYSHFRWDHKSMTQPLMLTALYLKH